MFILSNIHAIHWETSDHCRRHADGYWRWPRVPPSLFVALTSNLEAHVYMRAPTNPNCILYLMRVGGAYYKMAQTGVAIVTGANKGIGLAIVRRMCKEFSGDVILTARDESRGQTAVAQLEGEGLHPKFHQLDLDSRDSITTIKQFVEKSYGGMYKWTELDYDCKLLKCITAVVLLKDSMYLSTMLGWHTKWHLLHRSLSRLLTQ